MNRELTAVNSVLQVDLLGCANAEIAAGRTIAAPGGLPDFARGASRAVQGLSIVAEAVGSWWKVSVDASGPRRALAVPEMGEPLLRLIVDTHLDGWFDAARPNGADIYLPAFTR